MDKQLPKLTGTDICDFCSDPQPSKVFDAENFVAPSFPIWGSKGAWCACLPCAELVEKREWRKLADRAADSFIANHGMEPQFRPQLLAISSLNETVGQRLLDILGEEEKKASSELTKKSSTS